MAVEGTFSLFKAEARYMMRRRSREKVGAAFPEGIPPEYLWCVRGCDYVGLFMDWASSRQYRKRLTAFFKTYARNAS